jgi:hypothetical protein
MAALNDVRVAGWIGPFADTDSYYCTDPFYGIDGLRSVPDKATRNAITKERLRQGMFVVVQSDFGLGINTVWQLNPPPWTNTDADWTQFSGSTITNTVGGDLSGTLPNPTVVSTHGTPFGSMATQNANAVNITGVITLTGLPTPTNASDAATKFYVDSVSTGLSPKTSCRMTSTANLVATYNNGAAGVGATLTNSGTLAALILDGITGVVNDRVLIKDQTTQFQNGIYTVTTVGSASVAWVLTRATDYNSPATVTAGTYTVVSAGTANDGTLWIETGVGPFTIGTTPIIFTELNVPPLLITFTGDVSGTGSGTIATTVLKINGTPLGSTTAGIGNLLIGSGTQWVSHAMSGDATIGAGGAIVVASTNNHPFVTSAWIDTTNASNISSGMIPLARLGSNAPSPGLFLSGNNTWQAVTATPAGADTQIQYNAAGVMAGSSNLQWNYGANTLSTSMGVATSAKSAVSISGTFNNAAVTFPAALVVNITNIASNPASLLLDLQDGPSGGTSVFKVDVNGNVTAAGIFTGSGAGLINLPAANLTGTVPIGRLGSGTNPNSGTFLRDDNTWAAPAVSGGIPGGTPTQLQFNNAGAFDGFNRSVVNQTSASLACGYEVARHQQSVASGTSSFAFGGGCTASSAYDFAVGQLSIASGGASHAEGYGSNAQAAYSHAEGQQCFTGSSATAAHAEGSGSNANGLYSHAEGASTTASGYGGHSEGDATSSTGHAAHAEGIATHADGDESHAEGDSCQATGYASHAEGSYTQATGQYSHAQNGGIASGDGSHAEGTGHAVGGYSHAGGQNAVADLQSKIAYSDGGFTALTGNHGDGQFTWLPISAFTSSSTPSTDLVIVGGGGGGVPIAIRTNYTYAFTVTVAARQRNGSNSAMFMRQGMIQNNAGTVSLVGAISTLGADINPAGWTLAITADNTNKVLKITATGNPGGTYPASAIFWQGKLSCIEIGS